MVIPVSKTDSQELISEQTSEIEPANIHSIPFFIRLRLKFTLHQDSITQLNTTWDLELFELMLVAPTFLLESPCTIKLNIIKQVHLT